MEGTHAARGRARTDASVLDETSQRDFRLPARAATALSQIPTADSRQIPSSLRRRNTQVSRQPTRSTAAVQTNFTLSGPEETTQLRSSHEPFVHPGYGALNPSYEQGANARPVWSLAKPLPRVVRPGMVPTEAEVVASRTSAQLPGENSQKQGLDVDPNQLEKGIVQPTANLTKLSAQLKDSRAQREDNFINSLQRVGTRSQIAGSRISRLASATSGQRHRESVVSERPEVIRTHEESADDQYGRRSEDAHKPDIDEDGCHLQEGESSSKPRHPREQLEAIPEGEDDAGSLSTLKAEDEPELLTDLQPLIDEQIVDEVYNNHTSWSVFRTKHREFLAELLGVFVQLTIGFCTDMSVEVARNGNPNTTDWGFGFATMIGIYISGGISGAHLNPSITTMLWFFRGFPKRKMPEYFLAQFLGAFIAAFVSYGIYYASITAYLKTQPASGIVDSFVTSQRYDYIDPATAFFNEFVGTAILSATVLALGDDQNAPPGAGMNAFIIGLLITVLSMAFAQQTGSALNPSRDFGPRLALLALGYGRQLFTNPYWFYGPWAGTLCGAFVGGLLYDGAVFAGGESPVNYPWSRTKRAMIKSKMKWWRRLRLTKKEEVIR